MVLIEKKMNLFEVDNKYYLAHCIDKTASMGISPINGRKYPKMMAYQINEKYHHKEKIQEILSRYENNDYLRCILLDNVFHLVTKTKHYLKPTYHSLTESIIAMRNICEDNNIRYIAMPEIGCHADKLEWGMVREIIKEAFKNIDIEILVCSL